MVRVEEAEHDIRMPAIDIARHGFLFGGPPDVWSAGSMECMARRTIRRDLTAVAIAPDLGERYLDTVYQTNWIEGLYGADVLSSVEPDSIPRPV